MIRQSVVHTSTVDALLELIPANDKPNPKNAVAEMQSQPTNHLTVSSKRHYHFYASMTL